MGIAWQPVASGQNAANIVMSKLDLLGKRGIDAKFRGYSAGVGVNEGIRSERMQVGFAGNVPFVELLGQSVPVKAIALYAPNLKHSIVVPVNSPVKSLSDLKGGSKPHVIGIVMNSSAEFYFAQAAQLAGLEIGKDVVLKDTPIANQMRLPSGLAAVVLWEPSVTVLTQLHGTGREIDTIFPYSFNVGYLLVRQELIDNVPDVVQAISDSYQEAVLWLRLNSDQTADMIADEPMLRTYDKTHFVRQAKLYNNLLKPTYTYPVAGFWAEENTRVASWLQRQNARIRRPIGAAEFEDAFDRRFIDRTYAKLGWTLPSRPPFLPRDWAGRIGDLPYPAYGNVDTMKQSQAWPEPSDLVRPWTFDGKTYRP